MYVYAIASDRFVKFGISVNPKRRLAGMQTSCPLDLELVGFFEGDEALEKRIHKKLRRFRVRGEWFKVGETTLNFMSAFYFDEPEVLDRLLDQHILPHREEAEQDSYPLFNGWT